MGKRAGRERRPSVRPLTRGAVAGLTHPVIEVSATSDGSRVASKWIDHLRRLPGGVSGERTKYEYDQSC
jgi:hypothetical protein